jgi:hypothetical protein
MSDKYPDSEETVAQKPLPRRNRKPYEEYTPKDVKLRLDEARKDLTDPKSPLAKLLSDPNDLEEHLEKVERLLVSSIERAFIKVGKKFDRKRFVEKVSTLQGKSRPAVSSDPAPVEQAAPVEQKVIPEKKEQPDTAVSKTESVPDKTSKPEEVEKVVVVDNKGDLSGIKVDDLASPQKSADEEEDDTKSRGLLRRAGRDMFSTAFPTLSRLSKKVKGEKKGETATDKMKRLGGDVFKTAFPTLAKVIDVFNDEKKKKSTEGVREATRSRRALDKTESMSSSLQLLTSEQRKSVDLLEELLKVVKGLRNSRPAAGGRLGRLGRALGNAGTAPVLAGAAAAGATGLGAYALYNMVSGAEDPAPPQNNAPAAPAGAPPATPALSERPDPLSVEQRRGFQERQAALRQTDEELQSFRQQHGAPSIRNSRDGFSTEEFYEDPELQRQFNEIRQRGTIANRERQRSLGSAEFSLLGPSRFRDQGITGRDDGRMMSIDQKARAIDLLKTRYGYSEEELQRFGGGPGRDNFIQVGNRRYSPQVIGLFRQMVERDLEQKIPAAPETPATPAAPVAPTPPGAGAAAASPYGSDVDALGLRPENPPAANPPSTAPARAAVTRPQQQVSPALANARRRGAAASNESDAQNLLLREGAVRAGLLENVNSPGEVTGRLEGRPPVAVEVRLGNRTVNLYDQGMLTEEQRQNVDVARRHGRLMRGEERLTPEEAAAENDFISSLSPGARRTPTAPAAPAPPPPPPPNDNNADLVTRTSATGNLKDSGGVAATYSKSPVTPTNMSGMDSVLKAKTGTFKGDEIKFADKQPSQAAKPGVSTLPSVASPVPAPVVSGGGGGASSEGSGSQQLAKEQEGAAETGSLTFASGVDPRIKKDIAQKVQQIESAFGKKLTITSGFRDPHRNAAAGGAKNSAHTRANAVDIRFQGNEEETNKLIEAASAAGIGGIGVYRPGWVHLDIESKRVWGPDFSARTVPEWAKDTLQAHMTGQIQKSPAGDAAAAEAVAASPASPSVAQTPSSGAGGEGGGQMASSGTTAAAPAPEPAGNEMGAAVAGASQENAVAERTPVPPTVTAVQSESQAQPTPGAAVPDGPMKSVNDPGNVEPDDAAERYAKLFNMAA